MDLTLCSSIVFGEPSPPPLFLPCCRSAISSLSSGADSFFLSNACGSLSISLPQRSHRFLDADFGDKSKLRCRTARAALMENAIPPKQEYYTVGDFMTGLQDLHVVKPSTTVDEALELLVENRITGLPVVDDAGKLIGVVSDYDLLALDSISGKRSSDASLFPEAGSTWKTFREIQKLLNKTQGKTVAEVMTPSPLVVREMTNLEDAARLLLETKYRRLPVVDDSGKLVGLLTRGNVVRAALKVKRATENKVAGL